jgi:hypothetical protein
MTEYATGDRVKLARGPESKNTWPDDVPDVCYGDYVGRVAQNEVYPHRVRISNDTNRVFRDTEVSPAGFATGGYTGSGKLSFDFAEPDPWADHPAGYGRLIRERLLSPGALWRLLKAYPTAPVGTSVHAEIVPGDTARNESIISVTLRNPENPETLTA